MVYCPGAIMNSISSNPLNHAPNANDRHHHQVLVRFPSLPPSTSNPTDSDGTEEHAPAAAAADGGLTSSVSSGKSTSSSTSSSSSTAAAASDGMDGDSRPTCSTKKRKASATADNNDATQHLPEGQQPRKLKLPVVPDLIGLSDPSAKMKLYLNELVSFVKVQKEIEQKRDEDGQHGSGGEVKEEGGKKRRVSKLDQQDDGGEELTAVTSSTSSEQLIVIDEKDMSSKEPIETVVQWMDTFQDDEMIQQLCLQSLPSILENPILRRTAQSDGLASIVLYDMAAFPSNSLLILTAFHTLVVLLRPLGTNEGMVHKASAVSKSQRGTAAAVSCTTTSSKGIRSISKKRSTRGEVAAATGGDATATTAATAAINSISFKGGVKQDPSAKQQKPRSDSTSSSSLSSAISNRQLHDPSMSDQLTNWEENGVRVMLDSLRRYSNDRYLQAMGCWAMVNAALYPSLKSSLTKLGGVYAVTNAMMLHPNAEAVQFRGLFALINLVIPERDSGSKSEPRSGGPSIQSHVYQIARLTILAMKNFHTNKSILNRGCLVLRNLSLTPSFVKILGRTPGCVDMLLHCRQSCPRDVLVQRSARTIMLMIQTSTENEHDRNSFELTRPFPVPSQERVGSSSPPSSSDVTKDRLTEEI